MKYLAISEADTNYAAGVAVLRRINKALGYPNPQSKTSSAATRKIRAATPSTLLQWPDSLHSVINPILTGGEQAAVVTSDPGGYSASVTNTAYACEFDATKATLGAILLTGDSLICGPNGTYALAEPDRVYYKLNAMMPAGYQVISTAIGGKTINNLRTDFASFIGNIAWPVGVPKIIIIGPCCNDISTDGQSGWSAGDRMMNYIQDIKTAIPDATIYVCTPTARTGMTGAQKDMATYIKNYSNIESKGYKVIDLADDVHFGIWSSGEEVVKNTAVYAGDKEHHVTNGTTKMAERIYDALFPDQAKHPVLRHVGRWWWTPIPGGATYTTIDENAQHGKGTGLRCGSGDGLPSVYADPNNIFTARVTDSGKTIKQAGSFNDRDSGTSTSSISPIRIPTTPTIPDVVPPNTPNEAGAIYNADTGHTWCLNTMCYNGTTFWMYPNCIHAGAGLNAPPIFTSELDAGVIPHAFAINIPTGYVYWDGTGGFTWPATNDDSGANASTYTGTNPLLKFGSRLALPTSLQPSDIGVTSADGITIFNCLKTYGCIVSDSVSLNFNWHTSSPGVEKDSETRLNNIHTELEAMFHNLKIVT